MPSISRGRALAYAVAVLVLLGVGGRFLDDESDRPAAAGRVVALEARSEPKRKVVVHVVGAVERPGLYELSDGSRIDDALQRAGGAKPRAALELINLAAPVADGQQVLVPARTATSQAAAAPPSAGEAAAPGALGAGRVHLNTATLEDLDTLPGVGPVTAQKILFSKPRE